jgi:hypothetical protein
MGLARFYDCHDRAFQILENFCGGNAERAEAEFLQPAPSHCIPVGPIDQVVRIAVDLNIQARLQTAEIERDTADRVLFTKPISARAFAKRRP